MSGKLWSLMRSAAGAARLLTSNIEIRRFNLSNRFSSRSILSKDGVVVSIATYGKRLPTAYLTLESIARGSMRPCRLLLWLDNPVEFENLPIQLKRLQARGLEVKLSDRNYGPHKKYYPYVVSRATENLPGKTGPLVTADDDILYPRKWLQGLVSAYKQETEMIQCYRARVVQVGETGLLPYSAWELCRSSAPSFSTFAIGVSGVIYPPRFQDLLYAAGRAFEQSCPGADDLWLHVNALRNGFRVRQLSENPIHFPLIPGTQEDGLQQQNLHNSGNDAQIKNTYTATDVDTLRNQV
jgi:hypothetical protein